MLTAPETSGSNKSSDKNFEAMRKFAETYAKRTDTYFCADPSITTVVIEGLAKHKDDLGAPLCPCRFYEDKEAEVKNTYWNCPCVPMRERKECHCMLFLTPDNPFAGTQQELQIADS
jgi:ferredoxin-thioredoxin reductase catalytic chain